MDVAVVFQEHVDAFVIAPAVGSGAAHVVPVQPEPRELQGQGRGARPGLIEDFGFQALPLVDGWGLARVVEIHQLSAQALVDQVSIAQEMLCAIGKVGLGQEALVQVQRYLRAIVYEDLTKARQGLKSSQRAQGGSTVSTNWPAHRDPSQHVQSMDLLP